MSIASSMMPEKDRAVASGQGGGLFVGAFGVSDASTVTVFGVTLSLL